MAEECSSLGEGSWYTVANEFAAVQLRIDRTARRPRLVIRDLDSDAVASLDPLDLACLCRASEPQQLNWLAYPSDVEDVSATHRHISKSTKEESDGDD
jgi:hypothetical protein